MFRPASSERPTARSFKNEWLGSLWENLIVGIIGSAMGCVGKCPASACPLTATRFRDAVRGVVPGIVSCDNGQVVCGGMDEG